MSRVFLFITTGLAAVTLMSWWLTGRFRAYALRRRVIDIPNARSSHAKATPRGGGMAIAITSCGALVAGGLLHIINWPQVVALVGAGAIAAIVGFMDDHRHFSRRYRLSGHIAAAAWIVTWLPRVPALALAGIHVDAPWLDVAIEVLYVVWLLNLTNFMDGIDGIAGTEAVTVCVGAVVITAASGSGADVWVPPAILAAASIGFLVWNWPPARIFMGDGGSGYVGVTLAALSLRDAAYRQELFYSWLILLGVFIIDATLTLVLRLALGERIYEAHRTHAYQHAALRFGSHKRVTMAVAVINCLWLLPLAYGVSSGALPGAPIVIIAYVPIAILAWHFGAGRGSRQVANPVV